MDSVGAYQAKTHLPQLLEKVSRGKIITITKHGVPIAQLVPAPGTAQAPAREVIAALRAFRHGKRLAGVSLRTLIDTGRRS
ncbi:MAG: type II toxin-antitoxin system Phd/YefM family antitoxin [Chloroflexota bacterium]